jgi:transketolase
MTEQKTMRDCFIDGVYRRMKENRNIFFLCADFGSPKLDQIREKISDRFINVGIAEQNLINVATGLALEGFTVYVYAIAPFLVMRPYEQIRINLSLHAQLKKININLIGVGAGLSYDVSGPTHHCLEDITIMRALPHMEVFSPSDWVLAESFVDYSLNTAKPKYLRFDGKPLPNIYQDRAVINIEDGFCELKKGSRACFVSTGIMTHKALEAAEMLKKENIEVGVIDLFLLKQGNADRLYEALKKYQVLVTLEEAFINKGGLDSFILFLLNKKASAIKVKNMGFADRYIFDIGSRDYLHKINKLDTLSMMESVKELLSL